jgi:protocatechuate 3,4-dioxygenase beta subunit
MASSPLVANGVMPGRLAAKRACSTGLAVALWLGVLPVTAHARCNGFQPAPAQTEGPYFKAGSPARRSLVERGMAGTRLSLAGRVLTRRCRPVARALVDFWQADSGGTYDNSGYRLRGHQRTDGKGRYHLQTVVPGLYPGRTRHIHVKIRTPGGRVLTTQLYFPNEPRNRTDGIFDSRLVVHWRLVDGRRVARFDFVL